MRLKKPPNALLGRILGNPFLRYALVGAVCLGLYFLCYYLLDGLFRMQKNAANALAYGVVLTANYLGQRFFSFRYQDKRELLTITKYLAATATLWGLNQLFFFLCLNVIGMRQLLALVLSAATMPVISFLFFRYFVFNSLSRPEHKRGRMKPSGNLGPSRSWKSLLGNLASLFFFPSFLPALLHRARGVRIKKLSAVFFSFNVCLDNVYPEYLSIGEDVWLTRNVTVLTHFHPSQMLTRHFPEILVKPVKIEDGVFVGVGSIILPGVTIGKGSLIGAGSIVTKNVPAHSVVAGNPARLIRRLPPGRGFK